MSSEPENQKIAFLKTYGADEHFAFKTWENFNVTEDNKRAVEMLKSVQLGKHPGAYIRGPVGSGKTHIMKAMFNYVVDWKIALHAKGEHVPTRPYWVSMSKYLDDLRHDSDSSIKKSAQQATILFLDDIGTSTKTDWVTDQVFQLIDYRSDRELQTFMTSNIKIADLEPIYGDRIVSRLYAMCVVVDMVGKDRRKDQLQLNFQKVMKNINKPPGVK